MGPRVGLDGRKFLPPPPGIRSPDRPARSSVVISTELPGPLILLTFWHRSFTFKF